MAALIKKLWDVAWDQWEHRNVVLQEDLDEELQGEDSTINMELTREFKIGSFNLPH